MYLWSTVTCGNTVVTYRCKVQLCVGGEYGHIKSCRSVTLHARYVSVKPNHLLTY